MMYEVPSPPSQLLFTTTMSKRPALLVIFPSELCAITPQQHYRGLDEESPRVELIEALKGCEEYTVQYGQVIRFSWGQDDSPVHSETDFSGEDRVFVRVLFGSEEEIRDMCRLRRAPFAVAEVLD